MEAIEGDMTDIDLQQSSLLTQLENLNKTDSEARELDNLLADQYEIVEYEDVSRNGKRQSSTDSSPTLGTAELGSYATNSIQTAESKLRYIAVNNHINTLAEKQKFEEKIRILTISNSTLKDQVQILVDYQEEFTAKYNSLEQQHKDLQIIELEQLSEIELMGRLFREEKSKNSSLLKEVDGMQPLDLYKRDDEYFKSAIEDLRYQIKCWSRTQAQILPLSTPSPILNGVTGYVLSKFGHRESAVGPCYDFLTLASLEWPSYTSTHEGFKLILQAYVWRKLVELVFEDDSWAGLSTPLQPTCRELEIPRAYNTLRKELQPNSNAPAHQTAQFHAWRRTSARLFSERTPTFRNPVVVSSIRNSIIQPLIRANDMSNATFTSTTILPQHHSAAPHSSFSTPPKIDIQELDSIIAAAMKLGSDMAQQQAYLAFETRAVEEVGSGKVYFEPEAMYTCQGVKSDERAQLKIVKMVLAPRVVRWGSVDGKDWSFNTQVVGMEVELKAVERKN